MRIDIGSALCRVAIWCAGRDVPAFADRAVSRLALIGLGVYRKHVSRFTGRVCMFRISCSQHAIEAVKAHGWRRGRAGIIERLLECDGNYILTEFDGRLSMQLSNGQSIEEADISEVLIRNYRAGRGGGPAS